MRVMLPGSLRYRLCETYRLIAAGIVFCGCSGVLLVQAGLAQVVEGPTDAVIVSDEGTPTAPRDQSNEIQLSPTPLPQADALPPASGPDITKAQTTPLEVPPVKLDPASFSGVQPGETTRDQLVESWGQPRRTTANGDDEVLGYDIGQFRSVDVTVRQARVASILIDFAKPLPPERVANSLKFDPTSAVLIYGKTGELLGQAFPEHGVLFTFAPDAQPAQVVQMLLEPVSLEPFMLRAESRQHIAYQSALADLDLVLGQTPNTPEAHHLRAKILLDLGRTAEAEAAIAEAVRLEPTRGEFLLTQSNVLAHRDQHAAALRQTRAVLAMDNVNSMVRAEGEFQLGNQLGTDAERNYNDAIGHHQQAIKIAELLAKSRHPVVRREAKMLSARAHLAVARDIAWGNWKSKETVVPRWLERASGLVDSAVADGGDGELRLQLMSAALSCTVATRGKLAPGKWSSDVLTVGPELIESASDPLKKERLAWVLGALLYDGVQVGHMFADYDNALTIGSLATKYLTQGTVHRESTPQMAYLVGRLYYRIGVIHAVSKSDHQTAAAWYERALPLLEGTLPDSAVADSGARGETLVSMGVSFWETNRRDEAMRVTRQGMRLMDAAVKAGAMPETALSVPYANLASMHRALGDEKDAADYAELARKLGAPQAGTLKR